MPGATQVVLAVEDDEVVKSEALELNSGADAAETCAYDDRVETVRVHSLAPCYLFSYLTNHKLSLRYATLIGRHAGCIRALPVCDQADTNAVIGRRVESDLVILPINRVNGRPAKDYATLGRCRRRRPSSGGHPGGADRQSP